MLEVRGKKLEGKAGSWNTERKSPGFWDIAGLKKSQRARFEKPKPRYGALASRLGGIPSRVLRLMASDV
jgi:hypothetical protein